MFALTCFRSTHKENRVFDIELEVLKNSVKRFSLSKSAVSSIVIEAIGQFLFYFFFYERNFKHLKHK